MESNKLKQEKIEFYLNIQEEVRRFKDRIEIMKKQFYDQTMTSSIRWTQLGIFSIGFNIEKEVLNHLDLIEYYKNRISGLRKKQRYVNDYLQTLDPSSKEFLLNQYRQSHTDRLTQVELEFYEEIKEIEEAINHMRGIPAVRSTESMDLDNEALEDNFENILEMLEVGHE